MSRAKSYPPQRGTGLTVGKLREKLRYLAADMPIGMATGAQSDLKVLSVYETEQGKDEPRVEGKETLWFELEENDT